MAWEQSNERRSAGVCLASHAARYTEMTLGGAPGFCSTLHLESFYSRRYVLDRHRRRRCILLTAKFQASSVKMSGVATVRGRMSATSLRLHWWRSQPGFTSTHQHKANAGRAEGGDFPDDRLAKSTSGPVARVLDACIPIHSGVKRKDEESLDSAWCARVKNSAAWVSWPTPHVGLSTYRRRIGGSRRGATDVR
jgi:hypothetical protein